MGNEVLEYTVDKKSEGKYKLARFLMVSGYVFFVVAAFVAVCVTKLIPVFAVVPVLLWIIVLLTWRYVSIEYSYTVEAGMLTLFIIYGGKKKKKLESFHIKEAVGFSALCGSKEEIAAFCPDRTVCHLSSVTPSHDAYAFMTVANGKRVLVLLEAPEQYKKAIRYYLSEEVKSKS